MKASMALVCRVVRWAAMLAPLALIALAVVAFIRGTWATAAYLPRASDGPVSQIVRRADGSKEVQAGIVLPFAIEKVWLTITDTENLGDVCTCVRAQRIDHDPDGGCQLSARARLPLVGEVSFEATMRPQRCLSRYTWSWDEPSGPVAVNRGRWELTPTGRNETLVALALEVEVNNIPTFILRNLSLGRLRDVLGALDHRLRTRGGGQAW